MCIIQCEWQIVAKSVGVCANPNHEAILVAGKTSVFTVESVPGLIDGLTKFIGMQRIKKSVATWRNTMSRATPVEKMHHLGATFYWWPGFAQYWDSTKDGTPYTVATILLAKDALKVLEAETGRPAGKIRANSATQPRFLVLGIAPTLF